jgi:hypothetical protein
MAPCGRTCGSRRLFSKKQQHVNASKKKIEKICPRDACVNCSYLYYSTYFWGQLVHGPIWSRTSISITGAMRFQTPSNISTMLYVPKFSLVSIRSISRRWLVFVHDIHFSDIVQEMVHLPTVTGYAPRPHLRMHRIYPRAMSPTQPIFPPSPSTRQVCCRLSTRRMVWNPIEGKM